METYLKIKTDKGQSFILRDPIIIPFMGGEAYSGVEVNKYSDEVTGKGFDERRRIVQTDAVVRVTPMVMNLTYGELEPA